MKIATWNVNSIRVRLPHLLGWLETEQPDILCVQETKVNDNAFPIAEIAAAGYHAIYHGQKSYNGVAILSKQTLEKVSHRLPDFESVDARVMAATFGNIRVINLYVPNGSSLTSEKYIYKLDWLMALQAYLKGELATYPHVIVVGDFNIAPADEDVHDPAAWEGHVLVSPAERAAYLRLLDLGLVDAFRLFPEQPPSRFSWWDYRMNAFRRNMGLRIDLILTSLELSKYCTRVWIDTAPRKLERPSDHTPVIAEFFLPV